MNNYPKFIEVDGKKYKINTDFRIALECDDIIRDTTICDLEQILAVIYKLLGDEALEDLKNDKLDGEKTIKLLIKYLQCNKEQEEINNEKISMDFKQDEGYIKASFRSDYGISLDNEKIDWWEFNDLLNGLTENSVLNRVRYIREEDLSGKKGKEREQWIKMKKQVALKYVKTEKEKELDKLWEEKMRKE